MSATAIALATLLSRCAPDIGPRTMTAIVRVESDGQPLAIHDNTTGRKYYPRTVAAATAIARTLIGAGHSTDLGLVQVNSQNLATLGTSAREMFDPCTNLRAGASILSSDYERATAVVGPGPLALRRAIGAYNSGSIYAGGEYTDRILAAAGLPPGQDGTLPDLGPPVTIARDPVIHLPPPQPARSAQPRQPARQSVAAAAPTPTPVPTPDPYGSAILVTAQPTPAASSSPAATATAPAAAARP